MQLCTDAALAGPSLIKRLASCDNKTRSRSLRILLKTWLPSQSQISDEDMKKLWKGIFYCFWHADKLPAQTHIINSLSSVLPDLPLPMSIHYLSVFFLTMRREWTGIDGLRLDKFYLLIRKFLHCFFLLLKKNSWDLELSSRMMGVLETVTFLAEDKFPGNGVNYHIASVFLEELKPFLPLRKPVVETLLGPFVSIMQRVPDKVLLAKIKTNMFDVLLKMGKELLEVKKSGVDVDSGSDFVVLGSIALVLGFSTKFYELGSSVECHQGNRKVMFGLHEGFLNLEQDSLGIDIAIPEVNYDSVEDEVPDLIPIAAEMEMDDSEDVANVSATNHSNKSKKAKKGKKASCSSSKKVKKNKNIISDMDAEIGVGHEENENKVVANSENSNVGNSSDISLMPLNESVMSNLRMQFEKVAAELGSDEYVASACDFPKVTSNGTVSKKRKRAKVKDGKQSRNPELSDKGDAEGGGPATIMSEDKRAKRVRFSMKSNLVWKPQSPLPPQSLRLPPSLTPRGSALKKGIPPGPVREMLPANKKVKQRTKFVKKARKGLAGLSPAIKRPKKLKSLST